MKRVSNYLLKYIIFFTVSTHIHCAPRQIYVMPPRTPELDRLIDLRRLEGRSNFDIQKEFGTPQIIQMPKKHIPRAKADLITAKYLAGEKISEIAQESKISGYSIRKYLRASDIKRPLKGKRGPHISQEKIDQIYAAHQIGKSTREIKQELGVSEPTIRKYLQQSITHASKIIPVEEAPASASTADTDPFMYINPDFAS